MRSNNVSTNSIISLKQGVYKLKLKDDLSQESSLREAIINLTMQQVESLKKKYKRSFCIFYNKKAREILVYFCFESHFTIRQSAISDSCLVIVNTFSHDVTDCVCDMFLKSEYRPRPILENIANPIEYSVILNPKKLNGL